MIAHACLALLFLINSFQTGFQQPADLPPVKSPVFKTDTFTITTFGAVADGLTLNTIAINKAIDQCNRAGGGVVLIPRGLWLTGPIVLKSNVNLRLNRDALVQFTVYPLVQTTWEGEEAIRNQAPISGTDLENVAITGEGILDGAGDAWRMVKKSRLTSDHWKKLVASGGVSPAWCLHPLLCEDITLRNVTAKNSWYAQNGDGLNLESCRNGLIENCLFDVGDDGICINPVGMSRGESGECPPRISLCGVVGCTTPTAGL